MIVRWNRNRSSPQVFPFGSALADFSNAFRDFASEDFTQHVSLNPPADIVETQSEIQVKVDLPGHTAKDIQVKLEGDTLTIHSERKTESEQKGENYLRTERSFGVYSRTFVLPATIDGSKPEACYVDGVLTVTLPKSEAARPRVIEVKS